MFVACIVVMTLTVAVNAAIVVADLRRAGFVLANSAEVAVPTSWLPALAALKGAGAVGLVVGIAGVLLDEVLLEMIGVCAALGLALFFTGALLTHVRARVFHNLYFPGAYWLLALGSLVLSLVQLR